MSNYKSFGKTLLAFWIFFFIVYAIIFVIYVNKIMSISGSFNEFIKKELFPFPYIFLNDKMLYFFIFLTLCIFVFSLVHCIYIFSKKKEDSYTKKSEKDILNTTFSGYLLIIGAQIILFLPMICQFGPINEIILSIRLLYGLLMIIGVVLLSVGLSQSREKDKKMKELKSASIMTPVLIAISGIIYGIVPACCELLKNPQTTSMNPLINVLNSQIQKMNIKQVSPEKKLANQLRNSISNL